MKVLEVYRVQVCHLLLLHMGGGAIINDTKGFVAKPHDKTAWANAIKILVAQGKMGRILCESAFRKAKEYTWDNVGKRRAQLLQEKLQILNTSKNKYKLN